MRTKALLGLAVLAVSAATCVAQTSNVYSVNIVGYVNVDLAKGLNFISNPLKPSNGNYNITNTIAFADSAAADGASLYKWAGTGWASAIPTWIDGLGWTPDANVNLGEAFFIDAPAANKITFVGEVATGNVDYSIPTGLSAQGNRLPLAENFPGSAHGNDGDTIYNWTGTQWSPVSWSYIQGLGWSNGGAAGDNVNGPMLNVGQGVMYQNTGSALSWQRAFNPQ